MANTNNDKKQEEKSQKYTNKQNLVKLLYGLREAGQIAMIWGNPGMGKTSAVVWMANHLGCHYELLSAAQIEPSDLMGIPYLATVPADPADPKNPLTKQQVMVAPPKFAQNLIDHPNGIMFIDEITTAQPATQTGCLSLTQDCRCGYTTIPTSTFRIMAGNYSGLVGTRKLSLALTNRPIHIWYHPDADFYADGFMSDFNNYEIPKINNAEVRAKKEVQYRVLMGKLFKEHPEYVSRMPESYECENDVAFPTPRSWMNLVKILSVLDGNEEAYLEELIIGCVGLDAGRLFIAHYLHDVDAFTIDLTSYLGKENTFFLPHPERHDEAYQVMNVAVYYLSQDTKKYYPLWVRVMNLMHNKKNLYGNYAAHDGLYMAYLQQALKLIMTNYPAKTKTIAKDVDDWLILAPLWGKTVKEQEI